MVQARNYGAFYGDNYTTLIKSFITRKLMWHLRNDQYSTENSTAKTSQIHHTRRYFNSILKTEFHKKVFIS
jgi:hypothetical protein